MSDSEREMRCAGIETAEADPRDAAHARPDPRPTARPRPARGGAWNVEGAGRGPAARRWNSLSRLDFSYTCTPLLYCTLYRLERGLATFFRGGAAAVSSRANGREPTRTAIGMSRTRGACRGGRRERAPSTEAERASAREGERRLRLETGRTVQWTQAAQRQSPDRSSATSCRYPGVSGWRNPWRTK